jgi:ribonuclease P protein component
MLPKSERLNRRAFEEVFQKGKNHRGRYVRLQTLVRSGRTESAVVVPKSVARKAVDRNQLRRRGYAALERISLPQNYAFIVFMTPASKNISVTDLALDITTTLHNAGIPVASK